MSALDYSAFRPGCVVRLKGQTVRMTVISGSDADPVRRCAWFKVDGSLEIQALAVVALERDPSQDAKEAGPPLTATEVRLRQGEALKAIGR